MAVMTLSDFETSTEFERLVLSRAVRLLGTDSTAASIVEFPTGDPTQSLIASVSAHAGGSFQKGRQAAFDELLPLLFAAAWKILDLLVEHALANDAKAPRGNKWTIEAKRDHCRSRAGKVAVLSPVVRDALWDLYVATEEARHSLIHRTALVDAGGSLTPHDKDGVALAPIAPLQLWAACRAVRRAADAVITAAISQRNAEDIVANVAASGFVTLNGVSSPATTPGPVLVLMPLPASGVVNIEGVRTRALATAPGARWVDLRLRTDLGEFEGALDDIADQTLAINPAAPPAWLRRV